MGEVAKLRRGHEKNAHDALNDILDEEPDEVVIMHLKDNKYYVTYSSGVSRLKRMGLLAGAIIDHWISQDEETD